MNHPIRAAARAIVPAAAILLAGCDAANIVSGIGDVSNTDSVVAESFQFTVEVTTQTEFRLEGINGTILITGDPDATSVVVSGERKVGSSSTADARAHLPALQVLVEETPTAIIVRTDQPEEARGRNYIVDYRVTVPSSMIPIVANINGNIDIAEVAADVIVGNVNGNIDLNAIIGAVTAGLVNGNIFADMELPDGSDVAMATVNGNLTLVLNQDASARFLASWVNGGFTSSNIDLDLQEVQQTSVRGVLGAGAGEINMGTTNGQIALEGR